MNEIMYKLSWHYVDGAFSHCTVTPIIITRKGVLPGCAGTSITARDSDGRVFQGSPDNYYITEEAAWEAAKIDLNEGICAREQQIAELQSQLIIQRDYLAKLMPKLWHEEGA